TCEFPPCPAVERRDGVLRTNGENVEFLDAAGEVVDRFAYRVEGDRIRLTKAGSAPIGFQRAPEPKTLAAPDVKIVRVSLVMGGGMVDPYPLGFEVELEGCFDTHVDTTLRATMDGHPGILKASGGFSIVGPICSGPRWLFTTPLGGAAASAESR